MKGLKGDCMMLLRTFILMITCFCGAIMVCCVFPAIGNKVIDGFELIVNRRKMYREYLQRLNDYEEYSGFMEQEEKKYQEKWLIQIQAKAEQEKKEYIDSLSIK